MNNTTVNTRLDQPRRAVHVALAGDTVGAARFAGDRLKVHRTQDVSAAHVLIIATRDARLTAPVAAVARKFMASDRPVLVLAPWGIASGGECSWTSTRNGGALVDVRAVDLDARWRLLLRLGSAAGPACPAHLVPVSVPVRRGGKVFAILPDDVDLPAQLGTAGVVNTLGASAAAWVKAYREAHEGRGPLWHELWAAMGWAARGMTPRSDAGKSVMVRMRARTWLTYGRQERSLDAGALYLTGKYNVAPSTIAPVHGPVCGCP